MPIEFRCTRCNKLLRTAESAVGKQAKCPECGTIVTVPGPGPAAASDAPPPAHQADSLNPYQSPMAAGESPFGPAVAGGAIVKTTIDLGDVFNRTWVLFKQTWGMCLAVLVVVWIISIVFNVVVGGLAGALGAMSKDQTVAVLCSLLSNLVTTAFGVWLGIGQARFFLKTARGQPAALGDVFTGGPYFVSVFLATLLVGLIVGLGTILCIVPGVILALMFSQFYYLILDRNTGIIESLSMSRELTAGNKLTLFAIWMLSVLLIIAAVIPCGLGLLVAAPYFTLMYAMIYLIITGQPTAADPILIGAPIR